MGPALILQCDVWAVFKWHVMRLGFLSGIFVVEKIIKQ